MDKDTRKVDIPGHAIQCAACCIQCTRVPNAAVDYTS